MSQNRSVTRTLSAPRRTSARKAGARACRPLAQACAAAALAWATAMAPVVMVSMLAASGFDPLGLVVTGLAQTPQPAKPAQTPAPAKPAQTPAPAKPAQTPSPAKPAAPATAAQTPAPVNPVGGQPDGPPIKPKPGGPLTPYDTTYKVDAIEFGLMPDQFVEYKFRLKTGAMMVFNWKSSAPVEVDFHTVPDGKPISASETYMRGPATSGQGTYRAPYPGLHGWYWKNTTKESVTIVLNAAGFFTEGWMFSGDPIGDQMELHDPPPPE